MKTRRIIGFLLVAISIFSLLPTLAYAEKLQKNILENDLYASRDELSLVVMNHVIGAVNTVGENPKQEGTKEESPWSAGVGIKNIISLYDLEDSPAAYIYELCDLNGNPQGYVTVSAKKTQYPIISYQETKEHFLHEAVGTLPAKEKEVSATDLESAEYKYYYLQDGLFANYFVGSNEIMYDITTSDVHAYTREEVQKAWENTSTQSVSNNLEEKINEYEEIWNMLTKVPEISVQGHNGDYSWPITNPDRYESGWDSTTSDYCLNMGYEFYKGEDLAKAVSPESENPCGHVSGANLTAYWKRRQPTLCKNVATASTGVSVYKQVFRELYPLMGGDGPVTASEYKTGIVKYFKNKGVSGASATIDDWPTFETDCKTEISAGRPIPTLYIGHQHYAFHWVTIFGYKRYKYGSTYQNYLRIADGWSDDANRYDYAATNNSRFANSIIKFRVS